MSTVRVPPTASCSSSWMKKKKKKRKKVFFKSIFFCPPQKLFPRCKQCEREPRLPISAAAEEPIAATSTNIPIYSLGNLHSTENNSERKLGARNRTRARGRVRAVPPLARYLGFAGGRCDDRGRAKTAPTRRQGRRGWGKASEAPTSDSRWIRRDSENWKKRGPKKKREICCFLFFVQSQISDSIFSQQIINRWRLPLKHSGITRFFNHCFKRMSKLVMPALDSFWWQLPWQRRQQLRACLSSSSPPTSPKS